VSFINDDATVVFQIGLTQELTQQHSISHVFQDRFIGSAILETNAVTYDMGKILRRCVWFDVEYDIPTSFPSLTSNSSATRLATLIAATRLGCVQAIIPTFVYPASWRYCGICVVFPILKGY